jgi:glycosyltransferase involved in cell wall biosynthesis
VRALGRLDGPDELVVVAHRDAPDWLAAEIGGSGRVVVGPPPGRRGPRARLRRASPLASTGFFESLGVDVVHFPYQSLELVRLPFVYNPHDLQHRHLPELFDARQLAWRERVQSQGCRNAAAVAAESRWAAADVVEQYDVDLQRVHVIERGAPTDLYAPVSDQRAAAIALELGLPTSFALYPAATWPHKNHLRLVEALALVPGLALVCTGKTTDHLARIEARAAELGVADRVRFLGFVPEETLVALYGRARLVVVPSLFEGGGFPLLEAFRAGAPVACSNVTALPEVGGDAVLLFDPRSPASIADAIRRLGADESLRSELGRRGADRVRRHDWRATGLAYRELYRSVRA